MKQTAKDSFSPDSLAHHTRNFTTGEWLTAAYWRFAKSILRSCGPFSYNMTQHFQSDIIAGRSALQFLIQACVIIKRFQTGKSFFHLISLPQSFSALAKFVFRSTLSKSLRFLLISYFCHQLPYLQTPRILKMLSSTPTVTICLCPAIPSPVLFTESLPTVNLLSLKLANPCLRVVRVWISQAV